MGQSRGDYVDSVLYDVFSSAFFDSFFLQELREAKVDEFVNLRQGRILVKEYTFIFHQLSSYATVLMFSMRDRMCKFASRLCCKSIIESNVALLNKDMDISRLVVNMRRVEEENKKHFEIGKR